MILLFFPEYQIDLDDRLEIHRILRENNTKDRNQLPRNHRRTNGSTAKRRQRLRSRRNEGHLNSQRARKKRRKWISD